MESISGDDFGRAARAGDSAVVRGYLTQAPVVQELLALDGRLATGEALAATPRPQSLYQNGRCLLTPECCPVAVSTLRQLYYDDETKGVLPAMPRVLAHLLSEVLLPHASRTSAEAVEVLLSSSTFCDFMTPAQRTKALNDALGWATRPEVTSVLLAHGADPQALLEHAAVARSYHTRFEGMQTVEMLIHHGAFIVGNPHLVRHQVLTTGFSIFVEKLVKWGADATVTALLDAARFGLLVVMDTLVTSCNVDVDGFTYTRGPALIEAIKTVHTPQPREQYGAVEVVAKILSLGANPNVIDADGHTAICVALQSGNKAVLALLLRHGAHPNTLCCGHTPLHTICQGASTYADLRYIELLIECGADVNARAVGDWTPLHMLVEALSEEPEKIVEGAKMLLKAGADPSLQNSDGHTPVDLLRRRDTGGGLLSVLFERDECKQLR